MGIVTEVQHRAYAEFSTTENMIFFFLNICSIWSTAEGSKEGFFFSESLGLHYTRVQTSWSPQSHLNLKSMNQCADGRLSEVEAESFGVISILTHFLDLELLL